MIRYQPWLSLLAALYGGLPLSAACEVNGELSLANDYVWRGISQTDNHPALSGELDYRHASGLYIGAWASNVDFGPGAPATEIDVYAGFAGETADGLSYDVGVLHYGYPGAGELDTEEFHLSGGYAGTTLAAHYTDDYFGSGAGAWYLEAGADIALPRDVTLNLHIGRSGGRHFDAPDVSAYTDYRIGVDTTMGGVGVGLAYTDTSLTQAECGNDTCDGRVVLTLSQSF